MRSPQMQIRGTKVVTARSRILGWPSNFMMPSSPPYVTLEPSLSIVSIAVRATHGGQAQLGYLRMGEAVGYGWRTGGVRRLKC